MLAQSDTGVAGRPYLWRPGEIQTRGHVPFDPAIKALVADAHQCVEQPLAFALR